MKKRFIIIGIIIIALIAYFIIWFFNQPYSEKIWNMVLDNEEDYTKIAEIFYADFQNNNINNAECFTYSISETGRIFCLSESEHREIKLTDEELASSQVVYTNYQMNDNKGLDRIYVYDNYVSFCTVNGCESLVYSVDGKKPKHINTPDESFYHISIFRITNHWYYATGDQHY